ncbi:MAG: radical SAM family heme chaperone HemW [Bacteroidia bacterium]
MTEALIRELEMRREELPGRTLETVYFGGGTPSLLNETELHSIFEAISKYFDIAPGAEITLEANPDDLNNAYLRMLRHTPVNRFSIGIQSFRDEDLRLMNRSHTASEAEASVKRAQDAGFENITIDLIYALPGLTASDWKLNILKAIALDVPHLSSYCLTVEPKTALAHFVKQGKINPADEELAESHFRILAETTSAAGYEQYEISNFAKPGFQAVHNSSYWKGEPYLGIGPSAHSFAGRSRRWNVANNNTYMKNIFEGKAAYEEEQLSDNERFNEIIMTGLRTTWGVNLTAVEIQFGSDFMKHLHSECAPLLEQGKLMIKDNHLIIPQEFRFLSDGIAADLFLVD